MKSKTEMGGLEALLKMLNTEDWRRRNYLRSLGGRKTPAEYEELQELEMRDYKAPKEND